ncbi:MAG TPA: hypothetical protein VF451_07520, partial [Acidobacteriota bacterium]
SFAAGMAALKLEIPAFTVSPDFFPDAPAGNRELIARGCHAWDPASGTSAISAAMAAAAGKKTSGQRSLFEEAES